MATKLHFQMTNKEFTKNVKSFKKLAMIWKFPQLPGKHQSGV